MENHAESIASGGYYFWDPLAAVDMAENELVTWTPRNATVIHRTGDPDDGRTKSVVNGSKIILVTEPDVEAVESLLIDDWNG